MEGRKTSTSYPVIVLHPVPGYRFGLLAALSEAGFDTYDPEDPSAWVLDHSPCAILVGAEEEGGWAHLDEIRGPTENVVVALLAEGDPEAYALAIRAGADGAVPWDYPPSTIVHVVSAALTRHQLLPAEIGRALARGYRVEPGYVQMTDEEAQWLRRIADGCTIAELSREAGYSVREMYRLLHTLYQQLGTTNRNAALVQATRHGLLDNWNP